ncbi:glycosyltransferase family 4 protein [Natrinema versiforme]|uniref:Group 1 glycosyl transferase n=1 Tax=Natrinema versiforme JCM 10478 TaxID=1227496 RepID=L9Y057_9EURY|nr:glycosyltransferase family 4 protein [Natrinema versiforme]ELY67056.1 group 1 glycosyl transferase [Natrinema versiforme JCM 10478]
MANIAVFHPDLSSRGGGEAVCMNVLDALENEHTVTLYTLVRPDFESLNDYYRTSVSDVAIDHFGTTGRLLAKTGSVAAEYADVTFGRLQSSILNRYLDRRNHDLVVSTYNEFSFESPAIQYIHFPNFGVTRNSLLYQVYDRICDAIDGFNKMKIRESALLANSEWTAEVVEGIYGVRPDVVYPPIDTEGFDRLPWNDRESGFISIGRVEPSKHVLRNIEIVLRLRQRGHDVHLHHVGPVSHDRYAQKVRAVADGRDHIHLEGMVPRQELVDLICSHQYGLHGKEQEHFGMAVAELAAGRTLPFVHDSGGQREIVDNQPELLYDDTEAAVDTLDRVLVDTDLQEHLQTVLPDVEARYGRDRFRETIRTAVNRRLES